MGLWWCALLCLFVDTFADTNVFISEIMYNPPQGSRLEYLELHNNGATSVNLINWSVPAINYTFPAGSTIAAGQFLVVAKDPVLLQRIYRLATKPLGPYPANLANGGEGLKLLNSAKVEVHHVSYNNQLPWSPLADGFGSSLELTCLVKVDLKSHPWLWVASPISVGRDYHVEYSGTPGAAPAWKVCPTRTHISPNKILFSEIMYKPVKKVALNEVREFVEIYNAGEDADISHWRMVSNSMLRYTFPANTKIAAGEYLIIAKDIAILKGIYGSDIPTSARILGPYVGELGNGLEKLALLDRNGFVEELIEYDDNHGWPVAADDFGASRNFLPEDSIFYINYDAHIGKGLSLSRRSFDWPTDKAWNWKADFPSPGKDNRDPVLVPMIDHVYTTPDKEIIRAGSKVTITATLRPKEALNMVKTGNIIWFIDNIITGEKNTIVTASMSWNATAGTFTAILPALPANTIVRYRIEAATTAGVTLLSPYQYEPYKYWAYFVHPPPPETGSPTWHIFIQRRKWGTLFENINFPWKEARVQSPPNQCKERESWLAVQPAVLIVDGRVIDAEVRYQGSQYQRVNGVDLKDWPGRVSVGPVDAAGNPAPLKGWSWKLKLPRWGKVYGHSNINLFKMIQGCTMFETAIAMDISAQLGVAGAIDELPYWYTRVNVNGFYYRYMMILGTDLAELVNQHSVENCLDAPITKPSSMFKSTGSGADLGPYGKGNFGILDEFCGYPPAARYNATYSRVSEKEWGTIDSVKKIIEANAVIESQPGGPAAWLRKTLDMNLMVNYHALMHFAGTWDQTIHNYYFYHREQDGKWFFIVWDADGLFEFSAPNVDIYSASTAQLHHLRKNINKYLKDEYDSRMRLLSATVFSPDNMKKVWAKIDKYWNPKDAASAPGGWTQSLSCDTGIKRWIPARKSYVDGLLGTWQNVEKTDPWAALEKLSCPDMPPIKRQYNIYTGPPGDPFELKFISNTTSKVELSWMKPNSWGSSITGYKVTYTLTPRGTTPTKRQAPVTTTLPATATSFVVSNPGSNQIVRITLSTTSSQGTGFPVTMSMTTPQDCTWSTWSSWTDCTAACGKTANQTRTRTVATPAGPGGAACTGSASASQTCKGVPCPINCAWADWSQWTPCSISCGAGKQARSRTIKTVAQYGGAQCSGTNWEEKACSGTQCPTNCKVSEWTEWSVCSVPCDLGTQQRTRTVTTAAVLGGACPDPMKEVQDCNAQPCATTDLNDDPEKFDAGTINEHNQSSGLSRGALAGIVIAVIIGTALVVLLIAFILSSASSGSSAIASYQNL